MPKYGEHFSTFFENFRTSKELFFAPIIECIKGSHIKHIKRRFFVANFGGQSGIEAGVWVQALQSPLARWFWSLQFLNISSEAPAFTEDTSNEIRLPTKEWMKNVKDILNEDCSWKMNRSDWSVYINFEIFKTFFKFQEDLSWIVRPESARLNLIVRLSVDWR